MTPKKKLVSSESSPTKSPSLSQGTLTDFMRHPGCLLTGSLFHSLFDNPRITG